MKFFGFVKWQSLPVFLVLMYGLMYGMCNAASAQGVLDNTALLGMTSAELASRLPPTQTVRPPRRLSSGAVASLRVPDALYDGLHFEQTLYLAHQKLQQTDLVMTSPAPDQIATLLQSLRRQLGAELASSYATPEAVIDTATWVSGDADVTLFYSTLPERPSVRLVIRQRQLRDASEL
ncbi:MAG: hypothetical protein V4573_05350 [Pseudomonadota bacterium]